MKPKETYKAGLNNQVYIALLPFRAKNKFNTPTLIEISQKYWLLRQHGIVNLSKIPMNHDSIHSIATGFSLWIYKMQYGFSHIIKRVRNYLNQKSIKHKIFQQKNDDFIAKYAFKKLAD